MDVLDPAPTRSSSTTPVNDAAAVTTLIYLGFTLQLLQAGIVPLLPALGRELHLSTVETSWLLTSQLVAGAVFLTVLTRLADLLGKRRIILLALVLVLAGCAIGSFADSFGPLLVGRVLMGALMPMLALPEAIASDTMSRPARTLRSARSTLARVSASPAASCSAPWWACTPSCGTSSSTSARPPWWLASP